VAQIRGTRQLFVPARYATLPAIVRTSRGPGVSPDRASEIGGLKEPVNVYRKRCVA